MDVVVFTVLVLFDTCFSNARVTLSSIGGVRVVDGTSGKRRSTRHMLGVLSGFSRTLAILLVNGGVIGVTDNALTAIVALGFNTTCIALTATITAIIVFIFNRVLPGEFTLSYGRGFTRVTDITLIPLV